MHRSGLPVEHQGALDCSCKTRHRLAVQLRPCRAIWRY
ncbi:hypothetical protein C4K40_2999 [Pseudomonas sp. CMR5c]|nr:hypothetical protein C4K40_2999 [Pseudomonas sp. CMR5c]